MKNILLKVYITAVVPNIIGSPRVDVGGGGSEVVLYYSDFSFLFYFGKIIKFIIVGNSVYF